MAALLEEADDALPTSGRPEELLRWAGIDRTAIARTARALIAATPAPGRRAA
jgi:hypothetical protein